MSHGQDEGAGAGIDFATAHGRDWPSVRQYNVFVENRVGNLLSVVRHFETTDIRIVSLTVVEVPGRPLCHGAAGSSDGQMTIRGWVETRRHRDGAAEQNRGPRPPVFGL